MVTYVTNLEVPLWPLGWWILWKLRQVVVEGRQNVVCLPDKEEAKLKQPRWLETLRTSLPYGAERSESPGQFRVVIPCLPGVGNRSSPAPWRLFGDAQNRSR